MNSGCFGCVIFKGGRILATSTNIAKHSRLSANNKILRHRHAEMEAIKKCGWPYGAKMFILRVTKGNKVALAMPCRMCMGKIFSSGIKTIYFTDNNGGIVKISMSSHKMEGC